MAVGHFSCSFVFVIVELEEERTDIGQLSRKGELSQGVLHFIIFKSKSISGTRRATQTIGDKIHVFF